MSEPRPGIARLLRRGLGLLSAARADAIAFGVVFRLLAFTALTPVLALVARGLFALTGRRAVANADILAFALSPIGALATVALASLVAAVALAGYAGSFAIAVSAAHGRRLSWLDALRVLARRAAPITRLSFAMVLRGLAIALPFVGLIGLVHWALLSDHDINYYLTDRPPEFWTAVGLAGALLVSMAAVLADRLVGWSLALPMVVLGERAPRDALQRSRIAVLQSGRFRALLVIAAGPAGIAVAALLIGGLVAVLGDLALDEADGSLRATALILGGLASLEAGTAFVAEVLGASAAVFVATALFEAGPASIGLPPPPDAAQPATATGRPKLAYRRRLVTAIALGIATVTIAAGLLAGIRSPVQVLCVAHRAGAAHGPENSIAALRAAIDAGADLAEIDVQRAADGTVVVIHDRDLMKIAGLASRVAETPASELGSADIGNGEGIATLAEFCAAAGERIRLCVELKYYGWDEELAPATLAVLRDAGVLGRSELMSLELRATAQLRRLAPDLRVGFLSSVAVGDLSRLDVDFLAVANAAVSTTLIAGAKARGLDVYAWTLNDADSISDAIDRGIDAVITDDPPLFRRVLADRAEMTDLERLMLRFGALHAR